MNKNTTETTEAQEPEASIYDAQTQKNLAEAQERYEAEQENLGKINYKGHLGAQSKTQAATTLVPIPMRQRLQFKGESQAPAPELIFPAAYKRTTTTPEPQPNLSVSISAPEAPSIADQIKQAAEQVRQQADPANATKAAELEALTTSYEELRRRIIDPEQHKQAPTPALEMNGKTCFIPGELFCISGQAKSRKSFLLAIFAAALAQQGGLGLFGGVLTGRLPANKRKILIIDTEQAAYHTAKALKRARSLCNEADAQNIEYIHLNGVSPTELLKMVEAAAQLHPDLGGLIIDNGGDLLERGENDEQEAAAVANKLNHLAQQYGLVVGVVVHNARTTGSGDAAGHLGTRLARKAALHIVVSKAPGTADKTTSTTEIKRCRWPDPDPISFEILPDELGTPAWVPYIKPKTQRTQDLEKQYKETADARAAAGRGRPRLPDPDELGPELHDEAWAKVWTHKQAQEGNGLTKAQLLPILTNAWRKVKGCEFGEKKGREYLAYGIDQGYAEPRGSRYYQPETEQE
jgi:hypothetical protein